MRVAAKTVRLAFLIAEGFFDLHPGAIKLIDFIRIFEAISQVRHQQPWLFERQMFV